MNPGEGDHPSHRAGSSRGRGKVVVKENLEPQPGQEFCGNSDMKIAYLEDELKEARDRIKKLTMANMELRSQLETDQAIITRFQGEMRATAERAAEQSNDLDQFIGLLEGFKTVKAPELNLGGNGAGHSAAALNGDGLTMEDKEMDAPPAVLEAINRISAEELEELEAIDLA